jgi:general secretion pathway protein I
MNPRQAEAGFSLLEILVALAIIAIALAACVRAVGQMATSHVQLRDRALALVSAENALAELSARQVFPPAGRTRLPCPQGPLALTCERLVENTGDSAFRQVTVRVMAGDNGPMLAELRELASARP